MNNSTLNPSPSNLRLFITGLLSLAILIMPMAQMTARSTAAKELSPVSKEIGTRTARTNKLADPKPVAPAPKPVNPVGVPVTANLTDNIANTTKVDKGSTINYTATITNVTGATINGVEFQDTPDANTTLVGGSISSSAVANDDTYPETVIGNVQIDSKNVQPNAFSVLGNDYLGSNPVATITAFDSTSVHGGNVTVRTTGGPGVVGTFIYDPPAGYEGADSFTYTLSDAAGDKGSAASNRTGTVNLTVSGMVWFIKNDAAGCTVAGCGRLTSPFSTLAAFNTLNDNGGGNHPGNSDNIFVYESATPNAGGVILLSGQKLFGQDSTSTLATLTGLTPPSGSSAFPTMNTGGNATTIANSGGDGVRLASSGNNTLNGFTVGDTNGFDIANTTTTSVGNLTIANVILTGTGGLFRADSGGALNVTFDSASTTNGNTATNAIQLVNNTGTFTVNGSGNISGVSGTAVLISGGSANVSIADNVTQNTASQKALSISGITGGTESFSGTITSNGGNGVSVEGTGGTVSITGAMVLDGASSVFKACSGTCAAPSGTGLTITASNANNTVGATTVATGPAVTINRGQISGAMTFKTIKTSGGVNGILLSNTGSGSFSVTGTGAADSGGSITGATGDGISLNTVGGTVSFTEMNITNSGGSHIDATNVTSGLSLTNVDTTNSTDHGILGNNVHNLTISGGTFDQGGAGSGSSGKHGIFMTNLLGTSSVSNCTIKRSNTIQFFVTNTTATTAQPSASTDILTLSHVTFTTHTSAFAGDNFSILADSGSNMKLIVNTTGGATSADSGGNLLNVQASNGGKITSSLTGLTASNVTAGVNVAASNGAINVFNVFDNTTGQTGTGFTGTGASALNLACINSTCDGKFHNNKITHTAPANVDALSAILEGSGTATVEITNNTISGSFSRGIFAQSRLGPGTMNATITNNTVTQTDATGLQVIRAENGASCTGACTQSNSMCLNLANNNATPAGANNAYQLRNRGATSNCPSCSFLLQNFSGNGSSVSDIQTWVTTVKSNAGTPVAVTIDNAFGTSAGCATSTAMLNLGRNDRDVVAQDTNKDTTFTATVAGFAESRRDTSLGVDAASAENSISVDLTPHANAKGGLFHSIARIVRSIDSIIEPATYAAENVGVRSRESGAGKAGLRTQDSGLRLNHARSANSKLKTENSKLSASAMPPLPPVDVVVGSMQAGKAVIVKFSVTVNDPLSPTTTASVQTQGAVVVSTFVNTPTNDPDTVASSDATVTLIAHNDLALTGKTDGVTTINPGQTLTYVISYSNPGRDAAGVRITETVPTGTTFNNGASTAGWVCTPNNNAGSTCTFAVGAVSSGGSGTVNFAVDVNNPAASGLNSISNTASIDSTDTTYNNYEADINPGDNSASDNNTTLNAAPAFGTFVKTDGVTTAAPGDTLTYTISYANTGNQDATGVVLTETVPAGTTFVAAGSATWTNCADGAAAATVCTISIGALAGGGAGSGSPIFKVKVDNPVAAGINNIVNNTSITDDGANSVSPVTANTSDTDTLNAAPDLSISKTPDVTNASPGNDITYTINYSNVGNQGATGVTVTETVPANTTFVAAGSSTWTGCADGAAAATVCTNTVGALAGGGSGSLTFKVKVDNAAPANTIITNVATIDDDHANGTDPNTANNTTGNVNTPTCGNPQTVTSTADTGAGSLRQALLDVCDGGVINFNIPVLDGGHIANKYTITLGGTELAIAKSVTITGPNNNGTDTDPIVVSGNDTSRVFNINSGKTVTISNLTIANGKVSGVDGGGIINSGTLTITNSTLSGNTVSGGNTNFGGGIFNNNSSTLNITNSTLSGNSASDGGVSGSGNAGGGIFSSTSSTLNITNSTLSGNSASGGNVSEGGGIANFGGTLTITNSTLSSNSATGGSSFSRGGGIYIGSGTVNSRNTIISGNSADSGPDVFGTFTSQGHNFIGKSDGSSGFGATGDQVGTILSPIDPMLDPLGNNGGPTQTMALQGGSPALNGGDDCVTQVAHCGDANIPQLTSDQRGAPFVRLIGTHVDIGAFEAPHHAPTSANNSATTLEDTDYVFVVADFPFSDANDNPADTLSKVKITSLATAGTLFFDADGAGGNPPVAVAQNDLIPVADITAGHLFFTPASNANGVPYATFGFAVQDNGSAANNGADTSGNFTFTMNVTAVNDPPSITAGGTLSYTENDAASVIDNTITVSDIDSANIASATAQLTANYVNGEDVLSFTNTANISGNFVPGTGTLTLTGSDTLANYQAALRSVKYHNTSDAPSTSARTVSWTVNDGGSNSNTATSTINVTAVNDAPTLDNSGSPALTAINEDDTTNSGTAVSAIIASLGGTKIQDPDGGSALQGLAVTGVDNTNGAWQFSTNNGGSWTPFGAPADASARLLASDANTRIRFVPATNFNGTVNPGITFRAWDQTSGTNGTIASTTTNGTTTAFSTASETASITVNPVNDPPVLSNVAAAADYTENGASVTLSPSLLINDVDSTLLLGATVKINSGFVTGDRLLVFDTSTATESTSGTYTGLNIAYNYNASTHVLTLTSADAPANTGDTLADFAHVLQNVRFDSTSEDPTNAGANPTRSINWQVQDKDGTANGGNDLSAVVITTLTVHAVNDGPLNTVPGPQTDSVNTPLVFSSGNGNQISIADIDAGGAAVKVTLTATNGTITLNGTIGLAFTTGDGTADPTMTFTGTIANINAALNGMTFNPTPAYTGPASVQIVTDDQGNTGSGGAKTDSDTVTITVTSVDLTVSKTHSGNFKQADTGKTYKIKVSNIGSNPSSGTVTLTDNLPAGLTATGWGGMGWNNCTAMPVTGPAVLTCDRSDPVAANGGFYPDLTLTVDVSCTAAASITNKATVSGGGDSNAANNTANDQTTVDPDTTPPVITCPGGITRFIDSGQSTATINPGTPIATDNCGTPTVTGVRSDGQPLNAPYPVGITIITWTAKDAANNTASCAQSIVVMVPSGEPPHRLPPQPDDELLLSMTNLLVSLLSAGW